LKRDYLETTIPSYLAGRPSRDLLQAARQQITHAWWESRRQGYHLHVSDLVLNEISRGDPDAARRRSIFVNNLQILTLTPEAARLANFILQSKLLPAKATADAVHVSLAAIHKMDLLLTWNCQHIANADIMKALDRVVSSQGFSLPILCTPEELMGVE